jgi:hypothetical protein
MPSVRTFSALLPSVGTSRSLPRQGAHPLHCTWYPTETPAKVRNLWSSPAEAAYVQDMQHALDTTFCYGSLKERDTR